MMCLLPFIIFASPFMRLPYMVFLVLITSTLNTGMLEREYVQTRIEGLSLSIPWVIMFFLCFIWKIYYSLPYLKSGDHLFWEFIGPLF